LIVLRPKGALAIVLEYKSLAMIETTNDLVFDVTLSNLPGKTIF
jgi:hypothetical protein